MEGNAKRASVQYVYGYKLVEQAGTPKTQAAIDAAKKINNDVGSWEYMQAYLRFLLENSQIRLVEVTKVDIGGVGKTNLYGILESQVGG